MLPKPAAGARAARGSHTNAIGVALILVSRVLGGGLDLALPGMVCWRPYTSTCITRAQYGERGRRGTRTTLWTRTGENQISRLRRKERERVMLSGTPRRRGTGRSGAETHPPRGPMFLFLQVTLTSHRGAETRKHLC